MLDVRLEVELRQRSALHAREAAAEAALLVPERDDGERPLPPADALDRLEPREHAEDAVEATAVRHRVEVRADPDLAGAGVRAREPPDQVLVRVDLDGEPGLAEPARDEVVRFLLARAPADAIRAGARADRVDLLDPLENPQAPSLSPRPVRPRETRERLAGGDAARPEAPADEQGRCFGSRSDR